MEHDEKDFEMACGQESPEDLLEMYKWMDGEVVPHGAKLVRIFDLGKHKKSIELGGKCEASTYYPSSMNCGTHTGLLSSFVSSPHSLIIILWPHYPARWAGVRCDGEARAITN